MPENHYEIVVEAHFNKPRVMQMMALDHNGKRVPGVTVRLVSDETGSFDHEAPRHEIELLTAHDGVLAFRWVGWPAVEPHDDIVCWLRADWEREDIGVYFEDFPED